MHKSKILLTLELQENIEDEYDEWGLEEDEWGSQENEYELL